MITDYKILKTVSKEITDIEELKKLKELLISNIIEIRKTVPGAIGLSAIQLGIDKKCFIFWNGTEYEFIINPLIVPIDLKKQVLTESCLSFPDMFILVERANKVQLQYQSINHKGELKSYNKTCNGTNSIIVQHETDHCNGMTMLDRGVELENLNERKYTRIMKVKDKECYYDESTDLFIHQDGFELNSEDKKYVIGGKKIKIEEE
jgi:peptide deformylase